MEWQSILACARGHLDVLGIGQCGGLVERASSEGLSTEIMDYQSGIHLERKDVVAKLVEKIGREQPFFVWMAHLQVIW